MRELQTLNLEMFELFVRKGFVDLARDRLQLVIDSLQPGDTASPEIESQYRQQLEQLTQRVKQVEDNLMDLQVERQAGPVEKAYAARNQGAIGLAISELEEANRGNMSPLVVKPQLLDLYCLTGQPDRALELLSVGATEDPNLGTEPGTSFNRQGLVYLLLGNYSTAEHLWNSRAIPRLRYDRSQRAISMGQFITRGELTQATNASLVLPTLVSRQALLGISNWPSACLNRVPSKMRRETFASALETSSRSGVPANHRLLPAKTEQAGSRAAQQNDQTLGPGGPQTVSSGGPETGYQRTGEADQ